MCDACTRTPSPPLSPPRVRALTSSPLPPPSIYLLTKNKQTKQKPNQKPKTKNTQATAEMTSRRPAGVHYGVKAGTAVHADSP
jgi:hypothetical protein